MPKVKSSIDGKFKSKEFAEENKDTTYQVGNSASAPRFFFAQDDDCHWYQIPLEWRIEWLKLIETPNAWETEEWQKFEDCRIDGVSMISFTNPEEIKR